MGYIAAKFARMSRTALLALILFAALWASCQAWAAPTGDTIQTFDASGFFQNGDTLGGTITIDTTVGSATAADLTVSGEPVFNYPSNVGDNTIFVANQGSVPPNVPLLVLTLPEALVNYSGSSLVTGSTVLYPGGPPGAQTLVSGSLLPAACSGILDGSVPKPASGTPTVSTEFTPNGGLSLAAAATDCGFMGFNWQQTVTHILDPFPFKFFSSGTQITSADTPYNDPPKGGGYSYNDPPGDLSYPFYCNSEDFVVGKSCEESTNTMSFYDAPGDACFPNSDGTASASFEPYASLCGGKPISISSIPGGYSNIYNSYMTDLIGIKDGFVAGTNCVALYTCVDLGIGFSYNTDYNGESGGITVQDGGLSADPGSGTGFATITDYQPDTTYQYPEPTMIETVPEPPSAAIIIAGVLAVYAIRRKQFFVK